MRESFIFYKSFKTAIDRLEDPGEKLALYEAICNYALNGEEPVINGALAGMFELIRPQIDKNNIKYENGKKGGAPEGNQNARKQPKTTKNNQKQRNVNVNDNVNDNENVNVNGPDKPDGSALALSLLSYLGERSGRQFEPTAADRERVDRLLLDGFTPDDIKAVIDKKVAEWRDVPKMARYLRPSTLFGDKFREYLEQPDPVEMETAKRNEETRADLKKQRAEKVQALREVTDRLEEIAGDKSAREQYGQLKESEALLVRVIEHLDNRLERLEAAP